MDFIISGVDKYSVSTERYYFKIALSKAVTMPVRTVGEYLKRWGFTVQRPMKQAMNQKPEQVQTWLKETYPLIHKAAKEEGAEIFWGDETAIQNESNYARGYAPKGKTPVLKVQTVKMHINMISAFPTCYAMYNSKNMDSEKSSFLTYIYLPPSARIKTVHPKQTNKKIRKPSVRNERSEWKALGFGA